MQLYLSSVSPLIFVLFELIVNVTVLAHPQRVTTPRNSDDSDCNRGYACVPARSCPQYSEESDFAVFPCMTVPELRICCKVATPAPSTTYGRRNTTSGTGRTTVGQRPVPTIRLTTAAPILNVYGGFVEPDVWESVSSDLQEKSKLLPKDCGQEKVVDRILNGEIANLGQFPWMVLIGNEIDGKKQFWCGGTLISKRYVLTAAHCNQITTLKPSLARLGEWNISNEMDCQSNGVNKRPTCSDDVVDVRIEQVIVHERFGDDDLPSLQNDIALMRLASDVEFTEYIIPICLSPILRSFTNDSYTVSGWGVSKPGSSEPNPTLSFVYVYLFDTSECNSVAPTEVRPLSRGQFCAGGTDGKDPCKGDSGGPLTYDIDGKNYQKGIVSLATSEVCGTVGRPSIYTEVSAYTDWILSKLEP